MFERLLANFGLGAFVAEEFFVAQILLLAGSMLLLILSIGCALAAFNAARQSRRMLTEAKAMQEEMTKAASAVLNVQTALAHAGKDQPGNRKVRVASAALGEADVRVIGPDNAASR